MVRKVECQGRRLLHGTSDSSIHSLRLRLLAALSGVTVTVACAGRSEHRATETSGGSSGADARAGSGGTALGGRGGGGMALGGRGGSAGSSGSAGGDVGPGDTGGTGSTGGTGGTTDVVAGTGGRHTSGTGGTPVTPLAGRAGGGAPPGVGGSSAGNGGTGGRRATLGCTAVGEFAAGLEACDGSFAHRASALACPQSPHDESWNVGAGGAPAAVEFGACESDADCRALGSAYCVHAADSFPGDYPGCQSSCETDADCPSGQICSCDASYFVSAATNLPVTLGLCTPATCVTDADCAPGLLCIATTWNACGHESARDFHCQSADNECSGAGDCGTEVGTEFTCYPNDEGRYICLSGVCGRPFLVAGAPRQSEACESPDWRDRTLAPCLTLSVLDDATRAVVADHFRAAALMEHASIAAFARFSLQLLALGAPPDLVAASAQAMADETRHAEVCFELASRYGARDCGPGALALAEAFETVDLASIVELVLEEGCIGETTAALEARWAAEAASEPVIREVLEGIAADEEQHAALAFRFVAWALARDEHLCGRVQTRLRELATEAAHGAPAEPPHPLAAELAAHGVLSAEAHGAARLAALHDIVPSVLATFEPRARHSQPRTRSAFTVGERAARCHAPRDEHG